MVRKSFIFLGMVLMLAACSPAAAGPKIRVESAWARPADAGDMQDMSGMSGSGTNSAVYFVIMNDGDEMDTLVGVASEVASQTEMHETRIENDLAKMVPVSRVDVPAHGSIEFKPGGYHVMLVGVTQDLKEGDTFKFMLKFEKSGVITLDVPIQQGQ